MSEEEAGAPVEVPHTALDAEVLQALLEEFVSRDGTDYGEQERSLASKVADVRRALERGEARIVFDPETNSANVVVREDDPAA